MCISEDTVFDKIIGYGLMLFFFTVIGSGIIAIVNYIFSTSFFPDLIPSCIWGIIISFAMITVGIILLKIFPSLNKW